MGRGQSISSNAKQRGAKGHITDKQWTDICRRYQFRCAICRQSKELTADHIIPVSKGGETAPENIRPLCEKCNRDKGNAGVGEREVWDRMPVEAVELVRDECQDRLKSVERNLGKMDKRNSKRDHVIRLKEGTLRELHEIKNYIKQRHRAEGLSFEVSILIAALMARKDPGELLSMSEDELDTWRETCRSAAVRANVPRGKDHEQR